MKPIYAILIAVVAIIIIAAFGTYMDQTYNRPDDSATWKLAIDGANASIKAKEEAAKWKAKFDSVVKYRDPKIKHAESVITDFKPLILKKNEQAIKYDISRGNAVILFAWDSILCANGYRK